METTFRFFTWDYQTRLGLAPDQMKALLANWPTVDDADDESDACLGINNSLNELLNGVGISEGEALRLIGVSRAELNRIFEKWATARGWARAGVI